ncbi:uncharacterized protein cenpt isoform X2 [Salminus brasiliensis]|uniref:uncharacterized protein cenpt isoform X2 n=1 Tax=Salminus brasiliensis TaxID=930266 RepID=UPI003B836778
MLTTSCFGFRSQLMRSNLRETAQSTTQTPLPPSKRPRSQSRAVKTPAVASSSLYDEDITPRGLLRGIIQTEAEASLLLSGQPVAPESNQQLTETSIYSNRQSEGPSGLELPDLVTEPLSNVIRGMSRRRPPPTFNVSAFERQLDLQTGERAESDVTEQNSDVNEEQDLSAGSKSVLSLTLKTPFVNIQSERAGLRRKAASRRQPSVDAFDEAVQKRLERHCNQDYSVVQEGKTFGDSDWQKFTLGLSNVTVPDLTTDIVMSNTELYPQPTVSVSELKAPEFNRYECEEAFEADRKTDGDIKGQHQEEVVVEDQQEEEGVGDYQEEEDHQEEEMVEYHESESLSKNDKSNPEPFKDMEDPDFQLQEEGEEVNVAYSSQEKEAVLLSPDDIPFAPTQAMTEPVLQTQGKEGQESEVQVELEEMGWKESVKDLPIVELPSQLSERITRRAYRSESGTVIPVMTARGRATKSLGAGLYPTEKETQSFTNGSAPDELPSLEEEQSNSPASPSITHTVKHSPSVTNYTGLAEVKDDEVDGVTEGDISQLEEENAVTSPIHQSLNFENESPAAEEEEEEEEELEEEEKGDEEEDASSEELSMQTPAFIRKRKEIATPQALGTPTILKVLNTGSAPKVVKPHAKAKNPTTSDVLPKTYVMSVFKHFAKTKVASDVYPVINEILQKYFDRLADDLEAYSAHAKRKTIEVEDVELLMRRQGFVTDSTPVNVLIERFLPLEYRKLLIPVASSGNKVLPNQKR